MRLGAEGSEGRGEGSRTAAARISHPSVRSEQLLRFLAWLIPVVLVFAALEISASAWFRDVGSGVAGGMLSVYGLSLFSARLLANRGRRGGALLVICSGFLVAALVVVVAQPTLVPVLILAPLLAVGLALPHATERTLRTLFVAAWAVAVLVAVLGEVVPAGSVLPAWYESGFRLASLATAVAIVLLLLWQFRKRLVGALAQAREAEERAVRDATHDHLTGLPNRALLLERLRRVLERAGKDGTYLFAVLFLDLDRFKNVNDSLGHTIGDELLVEIAKRLRACVHPADVVARLGGDEFVVLLEGIGEIEDASRVAERLQASLKAPVVLQSQELYTTASIGIVGGSRAYLRPEDLLRDADTAMYRAKEGGKNRYEVFGEEMRDRAVRLLSLETALRRAVEREEFSVDYQPIVSLKSGNIVGLEALVRWEHPERGTLSPIEFIPLAEETELIVPIGLFVLREACLRTSIWRMRFPDHRPFSVNVNLSVAQLARPDLADRVGRILRETGLHGRYLRLEVTESAIMRDAALAEEALARLRDLGVRVHIDDFGTGYSSLGLLHRFPVDALKIDRSFVQGMDAGTRRAENAQIVQTILTLAHGLGVDVVAEGVDTAESLRRVTEMGCDLGQGYWFSKPQDASAAELLIASEPRWQDRSP